MITAKFCCSCEAKCALRGYLINLVFFGFTQFSLDLNQFQYFHWSIQLNLGNKDVVLLNFDGLEVSKALTDSWCIENFTSRVCTWDFVKKNSLCTRLIHFVQQMESRQNFKNCCVCQHTPKKSCLSKLEGKAKKNSKIIANALTRKRPITLVKASYSLFKSFNFSSIYLTDAFSNVLTPFGTF